ncbi:MAG: AMMECR1 domain-containing protein [Pseudomonadota bacterium]
MPKVYREPLKKDKKEPAKNMQTKKFDIYDHKPAIIIAFIVLVILGLLFLVTKYSKNFRTTDIEGNIVKEQLEEIEELGIPELSYADKEYLIATSKKAISNFLESNKPDSNWPEKYNNMKNKVYVTFRNKGNLLSSWSSQKNNLAETIYKATTENLQSLALKTKLNEDMIKNVQIHIHILSSQRPLGAGYVHGLHGLQFSKGSLSATYTNSKAIEGNYKKEKLFAKLCEKARLPETCHNDPSVIKYYFDTLHFGEVLTSNKIITFFKSSVHDENINITYDKIKNSLNLAEKWLVDNLEDTGKFIYVYNPSNGTYSQNNNMIRQLMGSRALAEMAMKDKSLLKKHKKNLEYIFKHWYFEEGDKGYILYKDKSKLGGIAIALRTLIYSPYFEDYKDKAKKLFKTILFLQNEDGSFEPWYKLPHNYNYDKERLLNFYSGEALLAMTEYYEKIKDPAILKATTRSQDFYIVRYVKNMKNYYYPAYVPWHTQSLNKLYKITKNKKYAKAIFIMNDELLKIQNQNGKPTKDLLGRFYSPAHPHYGTPHSASDGVYTEGVAYAYEIAKIENDEFHKKKYKDAIILGVHNLINLQYVPPKMYYMEYPERVYGAIRFRASDNRIRTDTTQHMIDAFTHILKVFKPEDFN